MAAKSGLVTSEQINFFNEKGFLTLRGVIDSEDLAQLRTILERLFASRCGHEEGAFYDLVGNDEEGGEVSLPQLTDPMNFAPMLRKTAAFAKVSRIARQLMGPDTTFANDHAILKPAHIGEATPWHQDEAYRADPRWCYRELSFWIPLQDTNLENGCMHYAAGTHKHNILPHRPLNEDPDVHALECSHWIDPATVVPCPLTAGDMAIHHVRTAHFAGANTTAAPRYAYILIFEAPPLAAEVEQRVSWSVARMTPAMRRRQAWLENGGSRQQLLRKLVRIWHNPRRYINKVINPKW